MTTYTQAQTKQLLDLGFSDAVIETPRRLVMSLSGREKTGKTHLACTAPGPIIFFNIDIGTEGVVSKFQTNKHIFVYDVRVPKGATKEVYETMWADLKHRLTVAYSFGGGTVVLDSVTYESPLVLKDNRGLVWAGTIEDFWLTCERQGVDMVVTDRGEQVLLLDGGWWVANTVWNSDTKKRQSPWTPIKAIIRHPYRGTVRRITTTGGTIRVTPNHSLKSGDNDCWIDAASLKVGDRLVLPMYGRHPWYLSRNSNLGGSSLFIGTIDLAWLYGFFAAEGSAWDSHDDRFPDWSGVRMSLSNKDESLIDKSKSIIESTFHVPASKCVGKDGVWKLTVFESDVSTFFRNTFYNTRKEKVVPQSILNAVREVKQAFLSGYMAGDGHVGRGDIPSFVSTSPALVSALVWMYRSDSLVSRDVCVYTRQDIPTAVQVSMPKRAVGSRGRIRNVVDEQYDGMVYDLETENHAFCAGVGGILAHNTATEAFELARLAHFGKLTQVMPHHYVQVNSEWRELLRVAYDSSMNTVHIHKVKPKWVGGNRTNDYEIAGFGETEYLSQVNVIVFREDTEGGGSEFGMIVKDCRHNPNLNGTVFRGPLCSFSFLLEMVHGKTR